MPLYNKAPYVRKAIESVLLQTYKDWELIVVDDGSTDGGMDIVDKFALDDSRIRCVSQNNRGVAVARNEGINISRGDLICFLDADDWWNNCFLDIMHKMVDLYPDAGIIGSNYIKIKNGKRIQFFNHIPTGYVEYFKLYNTLAQPLWTGSVCIKRTVLDEISSIEEGITIYFKPSLSLGEDFDLWVRIALRFKVAFFNEGIAYYNNDIPSFQRETGKLHCPKNHMLWSIQWLEDYAAENNRVDIKRTIDMLRVYGLQEYFLSELYHKEALSELKKVDWQTQPLRWRMYYQMPLVVLRLLSHVRYCGASFKSYLAQKFIL